jgi:predicted DNA-binding protein (MmcQ/YjbR family)
METAFRSLCALCLGLPGAWEDHPWGDTVYKAGKKIFACVSEGPPVSITVKAAPDELDYLLAMPNVQRAPYVGRYGWVTVRVEDQEAMELARDLIATSHRLVLRPAKRRSPPAGSGEQTG